MPMTATFPGVTFKNSVTGYRISACYTPGAGFQDQFYIYVHVRVDASTKPGTVDLGTDNTLKKGTLSLSGGQDIDHEFPDLHLINVEEGATRAEKFRVVEFHYDRTVIDTERTRPKFSNGWDRTVNDGALGNGYKFDLGGGRENVLSFAARRSARGNSVVRFTTLANKTAKNSWFEKVFDSYYNEKDFVIQFGGENIHVNRNTLNRVYLDETYGHLLGWPLPALNQYTDGRGDLVRMDIPAYTERNLIEHQNQKYEDLALSDVVQTATFIFNPEGESRNLQIP